jgi:hypothetical protein
MQKLTLFPKPNEVQVQIKIKLARLHLMHKTTIKVFYIKLRRKNRIWLVQISEKTGQLIYP